MGRYDDALSDLKRAVYLDPNYAEAIQLLDKAEAKVQEMIQGALAKEKEPDTGSVFLPAQPAPPESTPGKDSSKAEAPADPAPAPQPASPSPSQPPTPPPTAAPVPAVEPAQAAAKPPAAEPAHPSLAA